MTKQIHGLSAAQILNLYEQMLLIRRFEERSANLYGRGLIAGFCHLYIGQEAIVVGLQALMNPQDTVITAYRDHGHMLVLGMDPNRVMAELTGRQAGYSKGKGGSMHMFSREKNFFGGHGIVGAQVSIGTGLAFAHHYRQDGGVSFTYMGDGAVNQGQIYESFNMASLWKLPVLYVIENNQYSMGTALARHSASPHLFNRGQAYGIPGEQVDGMDVFSVYEAGQKALAHIRAGNGPYILEMNTYRYRGHSMSDPATYRSKEEVDTYKNEDPLTLLQTTMLENCIADESLLKGIEKRVVDIVKEAAIFAETTPEPDESELYTDVLIEN